MVVAVVGVGLGLGLYLAVLKRSTWDRRVLRLRVDGLGQYHVQRRMWTTPWGKWWTEKTFMHLDEAAWYVKEQLRNLETEKKRSTLRRVK